MACLDAGVPMVVIPLAGGDQAGNAALRCAGGGAGRAADQRTPEVIRAAVRDVWATHATASTPGSCGTRSGLCRGPEHAVGLLEQLPVTAGRQEMPAYVTHDLLETLTILLIGFLLLFPRRAAVHQGGGG